MQLTIPTERALLEGDLELPVDAQGLVLFAHGSGSSRFSPRNRYVAEALRSHGLGTLLFDLLTQEEELIDLRTAELRFDIDMLANRLVEVVDWAAQEPMTRTMHLGLFGSSTGAAAALMAAAARSNVIGAVVSRGGRPDLAGRALPRVAAPTLLLVGGEDYTVLNLNRVALAQLSNARLEIVPGATHLFEEPGTLEDVAHRAASWFQRHLAARVEEPATIW